MTSPNITYYDLSFTSPAAAGTVVESTTMGLAGYRCGFLAATLVGATGGTLDVYVQITPDNGITWIDYIHFTQKAAASAATNYELSLSQTIAEQNVTTISSNGIGNQPSLAANSYLGGPYGDGFRVLAVAGSLTTAGALQTIKLAMIKY